MTAPVWGSSALKLAGLGLFALSACVLPEDPGLTRTETVRLLTDADGDGLLSSPECAQPQPFCGNDPSAPTEPSDAPGCVIVPNPGGCAAVQWTEIFITTEDANGNLTSSYSVCELCLDGEGNPIGDELCSEQGPSLPIACSSIPSLTGSCWECVTPDGMRYAECVEAPTYCVSDEECPEGTVCEPFECPPNALCAPQSGQCVDACAQYGDEESCISDVANGCSWAASDGPDCEDAAMDCQAGRCYQGYQPDPCAAYTDQPSCAADTANGCGWVEYDYYWCEPGTECETGICAQLASPEPSTCYSDEECASGQVCQLEEQPCEEGFSCPTVMTGTCVYPDGNGDGSTPNSGN